MGVRISESWTCYPPFSFSLPLLLVNYSSEILDPATEHLRSEMAFIVFL
jgi:hypothetical protein